jgi:hypothetical protein
LPVEDAYRIRTGEKGSESLNWSTSWSSQSSVIYLFDFN